MWIGGLTGISTINFNIKDGNKGRMMIKKMFEKHLIADIYEFNKQITKTFIENGQMIQHHDDTRFVIVTADHRVADVITMISDWEKKPVNVAEQDVIV